MVQLNSLFVNRELKMKRTGFQFQLKNVCFFRVQYLCYLKYRKLLLFFGLTPETSSTQYCRPVRMQYVKENQQIVKAEYDLFMSTELRATPIDLFQVKHKLEVL